MTASCDSLQTHLGATNSHVEETLKGLQDNLSNWYESGSKIRSPTLLSTHSDFFFIPSLLINDSFFFLNDLLIIIRLGEVDLGMKNAQELLAKQNTQVQSMFFSVFCLL